MGRELEGKQERKKNERDTSECIASALNMGLYNKNSEKINPV